MFKLLCFKKLALETRPSVSERPSDSKIHFERLMSRKLLWRRLLIESTFRRSSISEKLSDGLLSLKTSLKISVSRNRLLRYHVSERSFNSDLSLKTLVKVYCSSRAPLKFFYLKDHIMAPVFKDPFKDICISRNRLWRPPVPKRLFKCLQTQKLFWNLLSQ